MWFFFPSRPQGSEQRGASLRRQADVSGVRGEDHRHHPLRQDDAAGDRGNQSGDGEGDRHPEESLRTGEHQYACSPKVYFVKVCRFIFQSLSMFKLCSCGFYQLNESQILVSSSAQRLL